MPKVSETEIRKRCDDIYGLVVDGQPLRVIRTFMAESLDWTVDDSTLRRYVKRCSATFADHSDPERKHVKGEAVLRLNRLYHRLVADRDLRGALEVEKEIIRLHGIAAPAKGELTIDVGESFTTEELAARFDELVEGMASRLQRQSDSQ